MKRTFSRTWARPIGNITARELLGVLRRAEERDALSVVHLALRECGRIFRYAIITGRAERDVAADLRGAFAPAPRGHRAAITEPAAVGDLLRRIDAYEGNFFVSRASRLWFSSDLGSWSRPSGKSSILRPQNGAYRLQK